MTTSKKRYHRPQLRPCAPISQGTEASLIGTTTDGSPSWFVTYIIS